MLGQPTFSPARMSGGKYPNQIGLNFKDRGNSRFDIRRTSEGKLSNCLTVLQASQKGSLGQKVESRTTVDRSNAVKKPKYTKLRKIRLLFHILIKNNAYISFSRDRITNF